MIVSDCVVRHINVTPVLQFHSLDMFSQNDINYVSFPTYHGTCGKPQVFLPVCYRIRRMEDVKYPEEAYLYGTESEGWKMLSILWKLTCMPQDPNGGRCLVSCGSLPICHRIRRVKDVEYPVEAYLYATGSEGWKILSLLWKLVNLYAAGSEG